MTTEPTTAISRQRRPRGRYPKTPDGAAPKREKRIPEYLEADEINAIIRAAPSPKAKLLMLQQWRAGLRVSEALDLEVRDLSLDAASPTLRVRSGKGGKTRLVPVHPDLHGLSTYRHLQTVAVREVHLRLTSRRMLLLEVYTSRSGPFSARQSLNRLCSVRKWDALNLPG